MLTYRRLRGVGEVVVARVERVLGHAPRRASPVRRPAADVFHRGLEGDHAAAVPDGRRLALPHLPVPARRGVPAPVSVAMLLAHEEEAQTLFASVVNVHCVRKYEIVFRNGTWSTLFRVQNLPFFLKKKTWMVIYLVDSIMLHSIVIYVII